MQYDILLTKQPTNGYLARPVLMPELVVSGESEEEALERVRAAIAETAAQSRIVQIDVPIVDKVSVGSTDLHDDLEKLKIMAQAASDPLFIADLQEVSVDFTHSDSEWWEPKS